MKKLFKSLLLVVFLVSMSLPSWGQASTQGREFWVALTASRGPDHAQPSSATTGFRPYIAVSAPKPCTIEISNPHTHWSMTRTITTANTWEEILTGTGSAPANQIPLEQWYSATAQPNSETTGYYHGLKVSVVEEDVEVSVYSALWWSKSFDATNVLPIHALGSKYIVATYGPSSKDGVHQNVFTILATEDCRVRITPSAKTEGNKPADVPFEVDLHEGEVYHVKSATDQDLNGSIVEALNGKKIAVYAGCILGNVPSDIADRDLLYEELFPLDYWGCDFVVARSKEKDANRIMILAEKATDVTIYGAYQKTPTSTTTITGTPYSFYLPAGEVYEFELSAGFAAERWDAKRNGNLHGITVVDSAVYIHTECPCAVISCDVGRSYAREDGGSEEVSNHGAPSMTWISPIQQMMKDVVFGVMGTTNTHDHFLNVIVKTVDVNNVTLTNNKNNTDLVLNFHPVDGNQTYSYARVKLEKTTGAVGSGNNPVYHLSCPGGFTASVYGNGSDESYAYTVGSSAIKRGVKLQDEIFMDGYRSDYKFCVNADLPFDAGVGSSETITSVDWNFGDGTTDYGGTPQTTHHYSSPGWYNVSAKLYGHPACTDDIDVDLGSVSFTFRVANPDTVYDAPKHLCFDLDGKLNGVEYTKEQITQMIAEGGSDTTKLDLTNCGDTVFIHPVSYGQITKERLDTIVGRDSVVYNGKKYFGSQDVYDTIFAPANSKSCDVYLEFYVKVITCLDIQVTNDSAEQHICPRGDMSVEYYWQRGDIKSARFVISKLGIDEPITIDGRSRSGKISLPTATLTTPGRYVGQLIVEDEYGECDTKTFDIDLAIYYSKDIFKYKFNNVLAVYNSGFGGNEGYEFRAYKWYRNDEEIVGANGPVLYLGEDVTFEVGDEVYVELTDMSGMTIRSCAQNIDHVPNYKDGQNAPARKVIQNQRMIILREGQAYDIYGQKVK